jgi:hypothetical protein
MVATSPSSRRRTDRSRDDGDGGELDRVQLLLEALPGRAGPSPATGGTTAATSVPIDRSSSTAVPHRGDRVVGVLGVDHHDERAVVAGAEVL